MSQEEHDRQIDYVEFGTTDVEQSKSFYASVFGWKFTDWGEGYASFEDGRLSGGFQQVEAVDVGGPLVVIYAKDLGQIEAGVREHGGSIVKETFSFPGGWRFHFADPEGNVLAVWSDRE
jgi:predicted enzyme related to lactoylglutathione lyase